jgi:hypothetical protein
MDDNKFVTSYITDFEVSSEKPFPIMGHITWVGVVEDIFDPLKLGRVRVRAIGFYNPDRVKMPTETLPWATVIKPTTGSVGTSRLELGDWVTGFFLDGLEGQRPTILGKYDGVYSQNPDLISNRLLDPNYGNSILKNTNYAVSQLTTEQQKMLRSYPKPALGTLKQIYDRPTSPLLSQGIVEGTAVGVANKKRVHVCDISGAMKTAAAVARVAFGALMQGIRAAIRAVLKVLGFNPESESGRFIELAKKILRGIKYVQSIIDEIRDYAQIFIFYAKQVRAMIDWILNLPKALAAMLAGCLNELLNAVSAGFSTLVGDSVGVDLQQSLKVVNDIVDSGKKVITDTVGLLTIPGQVVDALATPSTSTTQNAALNTILTFTSSFSTSNNSLSSISRP